MTLQQDRPAGVGPDAASVPAGIGVRVVLIGELKRLAGRHEADLRLPPGSTIQTLGRALGSICAPAFEQRILTSDGDIQSHVAVFLNGGQLARTGDTPTVLTDGQVELMLVPMYEGG